MRTKERSEGPVAWTILEQPPCHRHVGILALARDAVDAVRLMARASGVQVRFVCPPVADGLHADSAVVRPLLSDLLLCAIQSTAAGGSIHLDVFTQQDQVLFRIRAAGEGLSDDCIESMLTAVRRPARVAGARVHVCRPLLQGCEIRLCLQGRPLQQVRFQ